MHRLPPNHATHGRCWDLICIQTPGSVGDGPGITAGTDCQAGFAADYENKRCPRSFSEIKEFMEGHHALASTFQSARVGYVGHRHATRILSDCYGKSVVRSQQESANVRLNSRKHDVTVSESIKTTLFVAMPGRSLVELMQQHGALDAQLAEDAYEAGTAGIRSA